MNQLVEGMLSVCTRLPPVDWSGLNNHLSPIQSDVLSIALHRQLLKIGRKAFQVLFIRKNSNSLRIKKIVIPDTKKCHENRQITLERSCTKMLIHLVKTIKHGTEIFRSNGDHCR